MKNELPVLMVFIWIKSLVSRQMLFYELKGNSKLPAKNVMIRDVKVGEVKEFVKKVNNVENVVEKNVTYDRKGKMTLS